MLGTGEIREPACCCSSQGTVEVLRDHIERGSHLPSKKLVDRGSTANGGIRGIDVCRHGGVEGVASAVMAFFNVPAIFSAKPLLWGKLWEMKNAELFAQLGGVERVDLTTIIGHDRVRWSERATAWQVAGLSCWVSTNMF